LGVYERAAADRVRLNRIMLEMSSTRPPGTSEIDACRCARRIGTIAFHQLIWPRHTFAVSCRALLSLSDEHRADEHGAGYIT
jgi:hypothetical protein